MIYKEISIKELAEELDAKIVGDKNYEVNKISEPDNYEEKSIILVKNSEKWIKKNVDAEKLPGCIVLEKNALSNYKGTQLLVENYDLALIKVLRLFEEKQQIQYETGDINALKSKNISISTHIENFVTVEKTSKIGDESYIGHGTYIGHNVVIGNNVTIHPNCAIYNNTTIEDNVIIHSGVVIGADGFGYVEINGERVKIPQIGNVIIKNNVEIGANSCIDRSTIGSTIIGENTKIDNLCHIAHNVKIGSNCVIMAQTGVSGSCTIGNNCILAGQVGVADHVELEANTIVGAQSGVSRSSGKKSKYLLGTPARDMMKEKKIWAFLNKAPDILDRLRRLERKIRG
jgi:UDP-3-O-[3-hydroxymyristoyl] glucosamine N-acyltransferase